MVKAFLELRNREFTEKNVSTDSQGRSELLGMGYDSTPVTVIGERQVEGFDVVEIDKALAALDSE